MPNFSDFWTVLKQHCAQSSVVRDLKNSRTAQNGNTKNTLHEKLNVVQRPCARGTGASVSGLDTYDPVSSNDFLNSPNVTVFKLILLYLFGLLFCGLSSLTLFPSRILFLYLTDSLSQLLALFGIPGLAFRSLALFLGFTGRPLLALRSRNGLGLGFLRSVRLRFCAHFLPALTQTRQSAEAGAPGWRQRRIRIRRLRTVRRSSTL